jgi:hypothetical protein
MEGVLSSPPTHAQATMYILKEIWPIVILLIYGNPSNLIHTSPLFSTIAPPRYLRCNIHLHRSVASTLNSSTEICTSHIHSTLIRTHSNYSFIITPPTHLLYYGTILVPIRSLPHTYVHSVNPIQLFIHCFSTILSPLKQTNLRI